MKKKNNVWIPIAIAVLVLFVGSFFLIEASITGDVVASRECKKLEKCGFADKEDAQKLTLIQFNEIKKFYGTGSFQTGKSAGTICKELGCGGCFAGQVETISTYYESAGNKCNKVQLYLNDYKLSGCDVQGLALGVSPCSSDKSMYLKEPVYGDVTFQSILNDVLCSNCPTTLVDDLKALPWPEEENPVSADTPSSGGSGSAGGSGGGSS